MICFHGVPKQRDMIGKWRKKENTLQDGDGQQLIDVGLAGVMRLLRL
jgi:hypothetical protein